MLIEIENLTEHVLSEIDLTEKLLALLEDYLVDPLVAGGAPRDWFFDRLSNDIDIFVRNDEKSFKDIHEHLKSIPLLQRLSIKTTNQLTKSYRSDNINGVITFNFEFKTFLKMIFLVPLRKQWMIRISFSYLIRIKVDDYFLLVRNGKKDEVNLTNKFQPVGGVYKMLSHKDIEKKCLCKIEGNH